MTSENAIAPIMGGLGDLIDALAVLLEHSVGGTDTYRAEIAAEILVTLGARGALHPDLAPTIRALACALDAGAHS